MRSHFVIGASSFCAFSAIYHLARGCFCADENRVGEPSIEGTEYPKLFLFMNILETIIKILVYKFVIDLRTERLSKQFYERLRENCSKIWRNNGLNP